MPGAKTTVSMTEEEYIQFELNADIRHEFVNGQLIDMPGESTLNNIIAGNLFFILKTVLRKTGFNIFTHDTKLQIPEEAIYFYPDLFVCTEQIDANTYISKSAILVAEVLSKSTGSFDTFDKFLQYRKIPELQYYLLIEPVKKIVTVFSKNEHNEWQMDLYNRSEDTIQLLKLNISFALSELYE